MGLWRLPFGVAPRILPGRDLRASVSVLPRVNPGLLLSSRVRDSGRGSRGAMGLGTGQMLGHLDPWTCPF